jgi:hypothetical protein
MNIKDFKRALPFLMQAKIATMLVGHHGVGKSQAVKQYCDENGLDFVDLRLGTQDVGDLLGLADFIIDQKTGQKVATKFMRPEWFPVDPNSKGIVFLDEINRAPRDVLQAVFQLVLDKRIHTHFLPKGWDVVSAMNPPTGDYTTTDISDAAFMDRFCHIKLAPSKPEWFDYAKNRKFDSRLLQFLQKQPKLLQGELEAFSVETTPSRRSWEAVDRLIKLEMPQDLLREVIIGLVGTAAGSAFIKALNEDDQPITAEDILKDFKKTEKKIKQYSNAKTGGRMDMLKFTCDSILEMAQTRTKTNNALSKEEEQNLADFLVIIPKDLAFDLCRSIYLEEVTRPVIENHKKLLQILADTKKVEDIPTQE